MLDQRLSRCGLVACSALATLVVLTLLNWLDKPNWLTSGKLLHESIFISFNDGIKWLLVAVCGALALWLRARGQRHPAPPALPGALPLIGNAHQFLGDEIQVCNFMKYASHYSLNNGGVITMGFGVVPAYLITDPDDCLTVANACLDKPYLGYSFLKRNWLGNGLVTANQHTWKLHRKWLNPALSQKKLNMFVDVFNDQSRKLVDQWRERVGKGYFDPRKDLFQNILESSCRATLNMHPEESDMCCAKYITATNHLLGGCIERLQKLWLHPTFIFVLSSLRTKHDKYGKIVTDIVSKIIKKRKVELQEMGAFNVAKDGETDHCKTLLDLLLYMAAEQGVFTDSDIMDHLNTFIAASYDTTGSTLMTTLVLLGTHQDVQERVYKELQEVLGDSDEDIDKHILSKFVYLEAVLKESMRLYPAIPVVGRNIPEDVKLKNYTMSAGCFSILSIYGLHRHPMWGADAEQFRPERWLQPGGVPDHPNAFASFSIGRRNCIGKPFGLMSMKTILVHLLRRYHVTANASKMMMEWHIIMRPVVGQDISLKLRM